MGTHDCDTFRGHLRRALEAGTGRTPDGRPLAWHEHLFACAACRELLAAEEALDELLASLPEPRLPVALARRVVLRLAETGALVSDAALDAALDRAGATDVPPGLVDRVLAGLGDREDAPVAAGLDALLERLPDPAVPSDLAARTLAGVRAEADLDRVLDHLPTPAAPAGLADRVLAGLDDERAAAAADGAAPSPVERRTGAPGLRPLERPALRRVASAAAAAVLALVAGRLLIADPAPAPGPAPDDGLVVVPDGPGPEGPTGTDGPGASDAPVLPDGALPAVLPTDLDGELVATGPDPVPGQDPGLDPADEDLLEVLDVLEDWELLMVDDVDLLLGALDGADRELLLLATAFEEQG